MQTQPKHIIPSRYILNRIENSVKCKSRSFSERLIYYSLAQPVGLLCYFWSSSLKIRKDIQEKIAFLESEQFTFKSKAKRSPCIQHTKEKSFVTMHLRPLIFISLH